MANGSSTPADNRFEAAPRFDALEAHEQRISSDPSQRQGFIGGTDIQHVLSLEPYGCARRLWYQKTGAPEDRAFRMTGAIVRGKMMEDGVAEMVSEARPEWTIRRVKAKQNGVEGARVDRMIYGDQRGRGVLEIKTVSDRAYWTWKRDGVPMGYLLQIQWYMRVMRAAWAALAVLNCDTGQLEIYEFEADASLAKKVALKASDFWKDVEDRTPPPWLEERDERCESCQWHPTCQLAEWENVQDGGLVQIDGLSVLMGEYQQAKDFERKAVAIQDELRKGDPEADGFRRAGIEALLGDNEQARCGTGVKVSYKVQTSLRVDTEALKEQFPDVYAQVLKQSVSRPLRVLKIKGEKQ